MIVAILAGGKGTRLRPVIGNKAKPLVKIDNRFFLAYLLEHWVSKGAKKFVISIGYKAHTFLELLGDNFYGIPIKYVKENSPLGTGGALLKLCKNINSPFFLINGDTFCNANIDIMMQNNSADLVIGGSKIQKGYRYSILEVDKKTEKLHSIVLDNLIEKNKFKYLTNAGVYYVNPEKWNNIFSKNVTCPLEMELIGLAKKRGLYIQAFEVCNEFYDIGVPSSYLSASSDLFSKMSKNNFEVKN